MMIPIKIITYLLTIFPYNSGKLYWISSARNSQSWEIEQSNLDGSERSIVFKHNQTLASLTMDFDAMRLYYVYDNSGISYYDITTRTIQVVLASSNVMTISAVTVYNGTLYFPENIQSVIMSCDKDKCAEYSILRKNTKSIQYLKMFYAEAQQGANTCAGPLKGGCSHLCLATSNKDHICGCAIGYHMDPSNPTQCIGKEEFLFYTNHELKGIDVYDPNKSLEDQGQSLVSTFSFVEELTFRIIHTSSPLTRP